MHPKPPTPVHQENPLLTKRMAGALGILGFTSTFGLAAIGSRFFLMGMSISWLGATGVFSIYWRALSRGAASRTEFYIIYGAVMVALAIPAYIWFEQTRELEFPTGLTGRHLTYAQRVAIIHTLSSTSAGHAVYVASAKQCGECERYAQQIRDAIKAARGWEAGGSTAYSNFRGIKLYVHSITNPPDSARAVANALVAADIKFDWIENTGTSPAFEGSIYVGQP